MLDHSISGLGDRISFAALLAAAVAGCGSSTDDGSQNANYRYGAAEVEALVTGTWTGTWTEASGSSARLSLEVSRQPAQRAACGSRELGEGDQPGPRSSVQCVSSSSMLLAGNLSVDGMFANVPLTGGITVTGFELNSADVYLSGTDHALIAQWYAGSWQLCRIQTPNGALLAQCTLERAP